MSKYDKGEDLGTKAVSRIFVYVSDLDDVESIAKKLESEKYSVEYTIKAFDKFADSMNFSIIIIMLMGLLLFTVTSLNLYFSMKNFLRSLKSMRGRMFCRC